MRIVRFVHDAAESYGVLAEDDKIIDVARIARLENRPLPSNVDRLVSMGSEAERLLKGFVGALSDDGGGEVVLREEDVALKAPIIAPPKIVCLGLNYRDHAEEGGMAVPDEPVIFMKPRTAIVGPGEPIVKPGFVTQLDCEVELAIVIGKRGKNIPVSDAEDYIFGYTVFNDISARDIQFKDGQWTRGKSFDTFAPMGPCLITGEQIGNPTDLRLTSTVNGETRQDSSTRQMIFNVYEIVHHLSRVMTLEPCDIIATGTPAGVAAFMKPEPKFLRPGDTVEVWVEKIGILRNRIVAQE